MSGLSFDIGFRRQHLELALELDVPVGLTLLLGPNGAGKSTLLRLLAGLEKPDTGTIRIGERILYDRTKAINIAPAQRRIGLLFQHLALFPHLNVGENIAFGLRAQGVAKGVRESIVSDIARRFDLAPQLAKPVSALSGGERQKVALARTLAARPEVLLLDEPTATLDQENRWRFRTWLAEILTEWQIPTLMVTHDPADAASFRKRIVVLDNGRCCQQGSFHQLLHAPATSFVADFAGVNFIPGKIDTTDGRTTFVSTAGTRFWAPFDHCTAGKACLTVFPWEIALYRRLPEGSPRNAVEGVIHDAVILGDRVRVTVVGREKLVAEISRRGYQAMGEPGRGESVVASFKARESRVENV